VPDFVFEGNMQFAKAGLEPARYVCLSWSRCVADERCDSWAVLSSAMGV
jgi:hypothetical protein